MLSKTISKTISKTFGKTTDEQLIHKALAGSERAWFALVKRYEKRLYNYSLRMTGSPDDAMDVLQDVFMSVYRNLATRHPIAIARSILTDIDCYLFRKGIKPTKRLIAIAI